MAGNLMKFGFDLEGLQQQKQEVLKLYQSLFTELTALEKNAVSPMNMSGLTQLNAAVAASNTGVKELTANVTALNAALSINKQVTSSTTSVTKTTTSTADAASAKAAAAAEKEEIAERKKNLALAKSSIDDYNKSVAQAEKERIAQQKADDKQIEQAEKQRLSDEKAAAKESEKIQKERATALKKYNADLLAQQKAEADSIKKNEQAETSAAKSHAQQSQTIANAFTLQKQKVKELENEYILLKNSAGAGSPLALAKFDELKGAKQDLNEMNGAIEKAGEGSFAFGNALKGIYNQVRILAYVIPGIGIAGIFNLAFEAIGSFLGGIKSTNERFRDLHDITSTYNNDLQNEISLLESVYDLEKRISDLRNESAKNAEKTLEDYKAIGQSTDDTVPLEKTKALKELSETTEKLKKEGGFEDVGKSFDALNKKAESTTKELSNKKDEIVKINNFLRDYAKLQEAGLTNADIKFYADYGAGANAGIKKYDDFVKLSKTVAPLLDERKFDNKENAEAYKKQVESQVQLLQQAADISLKTIEDYKTAQHQVTTKTDEEIVYDEDQARKIRLSIAKDTADGIINENERILNATRSSEKQQLTSLKEIYAQRINLLKEQDAEFQGDNTNTHEQKVDHERDTNDQVNKLRIEYGEKRLKITDDYQKRDLQAVTEGAIAESKQRESTDQEEYKNIKEGFQTRLNALGKYLSERKLQIEDNYQKTLALESFQYATPEEHKQVETDRTVAKQQLIASAASEIASITTSYLREITKDLNDENDAWLLTTDSEEQYTEALKLLNEQFEHGRINADKFQRAKEKLNQGYTLAKDLSNVKAYDEILKNDKDFADKRKQEVGQAALELISAYASGDKDVINNAKTKYDLLVQANDDANKKIEKDSLASNKAQLKYEEDKNKGLLDEQNKNKVNWVSVEHALYEAVTEVIDARLQYELTAIETRKQAVDEMYNSEIDAIKRSSLASKEKVAYDIQLQAQKLQADKAAAKQERKLKHDEAILDKALAVAHIIWNTNEAVTKFLDKGELGQAITAGIIGGIELTKTVATPVPALKYGVEDWKGGKALFGEAGSELVKEPGKQPYVQSTPTVKFLPQHTEVIPMYEIPTISENKKDDSWQQTRYLASMFKKGQNKTATKIVNNINIDLSFELYKQKIFQG